MLWAAVGRDRARSPSGRASCGLRDVRPFVLLPPSEIVDDVRRHTRLLPREDRGSRRGTSSAVGRLAGDLGRDRIAARRVPAARARQPTAARADPGDAVGRLHQLDRAVGRTRHAVDPVPRDVRHRAGLRVRDRRRDARRRRRRPRAVRVDRRVRAGRCSGGCVCRRRCRRSSPPRASTLGLGLGAAYFAEGASFNDVGDGLGEVGKRARRSTRATILWTTILCTAALGVAGQVVVVVLERWLLHWHVSHAQRRSGARRDVRPRPVRWPHTTTTGVAPTSRNGCRPSCAGHHPITPDSSGGPMQRQRVLALVALDPPSSPPRAATTTTPTRHHATARHEAHRPVTDRRADSTRLAGDRTSTAGDDRCARRGRRRAVPGGPLRRQSRRPARSTTSPASTTPRPPRSSTCSSPTRTGYYDELCLDVADHAVVLDGQLPARRRRRGPVLVVGLVQRTGDVRRRQRRRSRGALGRGSRRDRRADGQARDRRHASPTLAGTTIGVKGKLPPSVAAMLARTGLVEGTDFETVLLDGFDPIAHWASPASSAFPGWKSNEPGALERAGVDVRPVRPGRLRHPRLVRRDLHEPDVPRRAPDRRRGLHARHDARAGRRDRRPGRGGGDRRRPDQRQRQPELPVAGGRDVPLGDRRRS